ncbi:hypothetical protein BMS3Bbin04_00214 [bacterium BMS3Bbin04]|nr:hypothetical protein BMS3Bbin04_00214 [bacterium BMS3Bbin04]
MLQPDRELLAYHQPFQQLSLLFLSLVLEHIRTRVLIEVAFEVVDLRQQILDFFDRSVDRDLEAVHRAFEPLQVVHAHHANQIGLAFFLVVENDQLLAVLDIAVHMGVFQIGGRIKNTQLIFRDSRMQFIVGRKVSLDIRSRVQGYWFKPFGEFAHILSPVVADDMSTGPCYCEFVKQLEECGIQDVE